MSYTRMTMYYYSKKSSFVNPYFKIFSFFFFFRKQKVFL